MTTKDEPKHSGADAGAGAIDTRGLLGHSGLQQAPAPESYYGRPDPPVIPGKETDPAGVVALEEELKAPKHGKDDAKHPGKPEESAAKHSGK